MPDADPRSNKLVGRGKHANKTFADVYENERSYIAWCRGRGPHVMRELVAYADARDRQLVPQLAPPCPVRSRVAELKTLAEKISRDVTTDLKQQRIVSADDIASGQAWYDYFGML